VLYECIATACGCAEVWVTAVVVAIGLWSNVTLEAAARPPPVISRSQSPTLSPLSDVVPSR